LLDLCQRGMGHCFCGGSLLTLFPDL